MQFPNAHRIDASGCSKSPNGAYIKRVAGYMHAVFYILISQLTEGLVKFPLRMLLAVLLIVPACNRNEPRTTQAAPEERANARNDQMKAERDAYVKTMEARLAEFDQKFDGLDKRADAMAGAAKTDFKRAIDGLRDQRKSVADKVNDAKKVSPESWTSLKSEIDSAMANLDRSYTEVSDRYKTAETSTTPKTKAY
jgi:hypothetical protein